MDPQYGERQSAPDCKVNGRQLHAGYGEQYPTWATRATRRNSRDTRPYTRSYSAEKHICSGD